MTNSMTAFAREETDAEWGTAAWELRSVNHRYLDVSVRLPDELRTLEPAVRERIAARVRRGKVEGHLRLQRAADDGRGLAVDSAVLERLLAAMDQVEHKGHPLERPTALDILRWPGVVEPPGFDRESAGEAVLALLERALDGLVAGRAREGAQLRSLVGGRCDEVAAIAARVRAMLPEVRERYRARLLARLEEARAALDDEERLAQELALFASRGDVAEELDRLDAHVAEVRAALAGDAPAGRRLDFLMQEMQREANTLGSKSVDPEVSRVSIDLKVLVEQMREQVQNIE